MVGGQVDDEAFVLKTNEQLLQVALRSPQTHLVVHPCGLHLHPVHDVIDLVPDDPQDRQPGIGERRFQLRVGRDRRGS